MRPKVVILSAFLTPFRSGAEACAEEVALRLCDKYDMTIVTARGRRALPANDVLEGKVVIRRIGLGLGLGLGLDKWLFPFLAPFAIREFVGAPRGGARGKQCLHQHLCNDNLPSGAPVGRPHAPPDAPLIIHAVLETFAGLALHFCRFVIPQAKRVLTLQTTNRSFLKGMIVRSPHVVTAISSALMEIAHGLGRRDVMLIPNGIDLANIEMRNAKCEKVPGRVLFVGRLERWKGVDVLLQAFASCVGAARCAARGKQSQTDICANSMSHRAPQRGAPTHLRVVGDGSQRSSLERLTRELGITDRVTFAGFQPVPDVYSEFAEAEIFCALSRSEALGNVFLEAQAAGCAVIGARIGGIPDIVENGVTGLLVPPDNVGAAADALQRLLGDEALRRRLAVAGRGNAKKYDWDLIAGRYAAVYDSLL